MAARNRLQLEDCRLQCSIMFILSFPQIQFSLHPLGLVSHSFISPAIGIFVLCVYVAKLDWFTFEMMRLEEVRVRLIFAYVERKGERAEGNGVRVYWGKKEREMPSKFKFTHQVMMLEEIWSAN